MCVVYMPVCDGMGLFCVCVHMCAGGDNYNDLVLFFACRFNLY